jgi:putative SOS response-associated peptidase YedK
MCGRYTLRTTDRVKLKVFGAANLPLLEARYNIAPSQTVLAVTEEPREFSWLVWGLVPSWTTTATGFINARAETLEDRASFSESFHRRRCLIPADGFYEWKKSGREKQPYYFQLSDGAPFAFAGIWDQWTKDGVSINSCAIITTTPNELLVSIHDRMPVILPPEAHQVWLDPQAPSAALHKVLAPWPAAAMKSYPVSRDVNHTGIDDPHLIEPVEPGLSMTPTLFEI